MEFLTNERKRFNQIKGYILEELKTDRHILACLGSVGLTFTSDINRFREYLNFKGNHNLIRIIDNNRSLTRKELKKL